MYKPNGPPPPGFAPPPPYEPQYPPQYPPGPGVTTTTQNVYVMQPIVLGPDSQAITCPHCGADIATRVETEATLKTHLFALLLCLFVCWPCAPCPYCIDSCLAKKHYCPRCKSFLGQYDA